MNDQSNFKDRFSKQSAEYAKFRPQYPKKIFDWLASLPSQKNRAWDCGTGNGQAAREIAEHFEKVIATDPSAAQIEKAKPHVRVEYKVEPAERTSIKSSSIDLVTAATAAHWFNLDLFYAEVNRVVKKGGWLAIFAYGHDRTMTTEIDTVLNQFGYVELLAYWEPELKRIWECYRTIPFPFREIDAPKITLDIDFTLDQLMGYLATWSAVQKFIDVHAQSPLPKVRTKLEKIWGDPARAHKMTWPVYFRVGQV